jgi:hypothetical protein
MSELSNKSAKVLIVISLLITSLHDAPSRAESLNQPAPEAVVIAFCDLYSKSLEFSTAHSDEISKYTTWKDIPGWDRADIIFDYKIKSVQRSKGTAQVIVLYRKAGYVESGATHLELHLSDTYEQVIFNLVNINSFWKISDPALPPHITLDTAINILGAEMSTMSSKERSIRKNDILVLQRIRSRQH